MLFGSLWYTNELSVLFAGTGVGKTILAVQIAHLVSSGKSFGPFTNQSAPQNRVYVANETTANVSIFNVSLPVEPAPGPGGRPV